MSFQPNFIHPACQMSFKSVPIFYCFQQPINPQPNQSQLLSWVLEVWHSLLGLLAYLLPLAVLKHRSSLDVDMCSNSGRISAKKKKKSIFLSLHIVTLHKPFYCQDVVFSRKRRSNIHIRNFIIRKHFNYQLLQLQNNTSARSDCI